MHRLDPVGTKKCYTCERVLPLTCFGNRQNSRDGKAHWCFDCARDYHAAYRRKNPELIRAIQKRTRKKNHEKYLEYQRYATQMRKKMLASPDGIL